MDEATPTVYEHEHENMAHTNLDSNLVDMLAITYAGDSSKGKSCKQMQLDYTAITNGHAAPPQEHDLVSQIHHHDFLDSYACLQSLIGGMFDHFFVSTKTEL